MRISTDRLRRRLKDGGHLVDRQQEKVAQDECTASLVVDAFECLAEESRDLNRPRRAAVKLGPATLAGDETACAVETRQEWLQRAGRPVGIALPLGQCGLHGDPIQPCGELRTRWKGRELAPGGKESLLERLFSVARGRAHVPRDRVHRLAVPRRERGEAAPLPLRARSASNWSDATESSSCLGEIIISGQEGSRIRTNDPAVIKPSKFEESAFLDRFIDRGCRISAQCRHHH